jgi:hypothetical protein
MDETRRSLIKGMLTGGTLLALGTPSITQAVSISQSPSGSTRNCQLLLGNTTIDEAFARGAYAACTSYTNYRQGTLPIIRLEDELLTNPLRVAELLTQSRNIRWIAVMDDASAAIFTELVRNFEGRLLSLGSHSFSSGNDVSFPLRHVWATASPAYSAGGLLASELIPNQHNFSIVENFLGESVGDGVIKGSSISGFLSYRLSEQPTTYLHCAGISLIEASQLVGWKGAENWGSVLPRVDKFQTYEDKTANDAAIKHPQLENWIETTGYAVVATALGLGTNQESCSARAFVHRPSQRNRNNQELSGKHFVSFVIDV